MEKQKATHMFTVCTSLNNGYSYAFGQLDRLVEQEISKISRATKIKIVAWEDKVFPAINPEILVPDFQKIISRVIVFEYIYI